LISLWDKCFFVSETRKETQMSDLKLVLMKRDEITSDEADDLINAAREELFELIDQGETEEAENIYENHFGLEADYVMDLMY